MSCLDAQIGQLLQGLERLGLSDNTIVVVFSDNGFLLGQHGQWQKQFLFDDSARVPLILYVPGAKRNGKPVLGPVELLDVYPTLRELCASRSRRSGWKAGALTAPLDDPTAASDRPAYCQVTRRTGRGRNTERIMAYSVRTPRWRYTEWGPRARELYDHEADPQEFRNLAEDPRHSETVREMHALLSRVRP